jgi:hypothetical protein
MSVEGTVYVVFPAALLDGWDVVKEPSDQSVLFDSQEKAVAYARDRAESDGGGTVRIENWYGDLERALEVHPRGDSKGSSATGRNRAQAGSGSIRPRPSFFGLLTRRMTG